MKDGGSSSNQKSTKKNPKGENKDKSMHAYVGEFGGLRNEKRLAMDCQAFVLLSLASAT
jgi:hypothetical protein